MQCLKFFSALCKFIRLKYNLWLWEYKKSTIPKLFQEISSKYPTKIAYYYEDEAWTYQEVSFNFFLFYINY